MGLSSKEVSSVQVQHEPLKCPRCDSTNTKFCYYNNYNKSQPRHFCKACKRHWTKGGTLRNVPVGGGRKNKRKVSKPATPKTPQQEPRPTQVQIGTLGDIDQKNLPEAFYQTLGRHPLCSMPESSINLRNKSINDGNNGVFMGCFEQELNFPYSNLGNFSISSSIQTPNLYNFTEDHETVIDSLNPNQQEPITWSMAHNHSSNLMGISSSWGWDDFEKFVSVDEAELTLPWDDADNIKPG